MGRARCSQPRCALRVCCYGWCLKPPTILNLHLFLRKVSTGNNFFALGAGEGERQGRASEQLCCGGLLSLVSSCIGQDPTKVAECAVADTDGDGDVDNVDLDFVLDSFGETGFPTEGDACLNSDLRATVIIGSCNSDVPNIDIASGCTLAVLVHEVLASSGDDDALADFLEDLEGQNVLTEDEAEAIEDCADDTDDDDDDD